MRHKQPTYYNLHIKKVRIRAPCLNGFTLQGSGGGSSADGIYLSNCLPLCSTTPADTFEVRNGTIRDFGGHAVNAMAMSKKIVDVKIDRPRDYRLLSSEEFRVLVQETKEAVHEEAVKAFEAGERELA